MVTEAVPTETEGRPCWSSHKAGGRHVLTPTRLPSSLVKSKWSKIKIQAARNSMADFSSPLSPPYSPCGDARTPTERNVASAAVKLTSAKSPTLFPSHFVDRQSQLVSPCARRKQLTVKPSAPLVGDGSLKLSKNLCLNKRLPKKDSTGNITMGTPHYSQLPYQVRPTAEEVSTFFLLKQVSLLRIEF